MFKKAAHARWGDENLNDIARRRRCFSDFNKRRRSDDEQYIRSLATCIHLMGLSLDDMFERIPAPWNRLKAASTVILVVGKRPIGSGPLTHFAAGSHDLDAVAHLMSFIQRDLHCDCSIELKYVCNQQTVDRPSRVERLREMLRSRTTTYPGYGHYPGSRSRELGQTVF